MQVRPRPNRLAKSFLVAGVFAAASSFGGSAMAAPVLQLQFPGPSEVTSQQNQALTSFRLAVGPYANGLVPAAIAEGSLQQSAWRISMPQPSTLELLQTLREQIAQAGFKLMFECETESCGGFDFRFATDVLPEPEMHVDLGDFRYLAAERLGPQGKEFISLLVSRSAQNGFVQLTRIGLGEAEITTSTKTPLLREAQQIPVTAIKPVDASPASLAELGKRLDLGLPQVLEDLVFGSGSATLSAGDYASLRDLAAWLKANPDLTITLVGHTDASGAMASNIGLSKKRAESVRQYLLFNFDIPAAQVVSNGVGPLAPRDSNGTDQGRQKNRRVEVFLTSTR